MSIINRIISIVFVGREPDTTISTSDYPKLKIWKKETMPVLKELERQKYINIRYTKKNVKFKIRKPITQSVVNRIC